MLLAVGAQIAAAADGPRPLDLIDLGAPTFTTFTARDGVPDAAIVSLATDAEGFVWLASPKGVARYDGHRWERAPHPFNARVMHLLLGHEHSLWAALYDKGIARFDGSRWHLENRQTGLPTDHFRRILETPHPDGRVETWGLSVDAGLLRRINGQWQADPGNVQLPRQALLDIARTSEIGGQNRLWVGTHNEGLWYREEGGDWVHFRAPGFDPSQIEGLLTTRRRGHEELWIAGFGIGLWRLTNEGFTSWTVESGDLKSNLVYRMAVTTLPNGDQVVWVATRNGLVLVHGDSFQVFDRRHGLPSNVIRDLHVWRSPTGTDVLWIATEAGVARTIPGASTWQIASLMGADGIGVFGVWVEPDGRGGERLWVAASQGGLGLYENSRWRTFSFESGHLPSSGLRVVKRLPDETGRRVLWLGMIGGDLIRVEDGPRFVRLATPWEKSNAQAVMDIMSRTVDGNYEQWIATRTSGVYRRCNGLWTAYRPSTISGQWTTTKLLEQIDRSGRSWLWATSNQGLARFDGTRWTLLGAEFGLPDSGFLGLSILPDRDGNPLLWVGSSRNGIVRIEVADPLYPRVLPSEELPAPPDPVAYSALPDSQGRIYICTDNGVQLLEPDSSGGFRQRLFGRRDGMVHEECNTNAQTIDSHDRFWTGTLGGLAAYDPARELHDRRPKPLKLTHVRIDGTETSPRELRIPHEAHELRFDFALLSWQRESESRFRTELVGFDVEPGPWVTQNHRIFGELPPGPYVLRVEAHDYAENKSRSLEIPFDVLPAWWERQWFRVFVIVFFALAGPLFYFYRMGRVTHQKVELEAIVASRTAELATANDQLSRLSRQDSLTGVANRRRLDEVLDEEWRRAVRHRTSLSFLLLDIDHFKDYNDHLGHQAGDACLKRVAKAVADNHTRAGELVARYGGEEFGVVIPGVGLDGALVSAENVRESVAVLALPHPGSIANSVVTVSVGVASAQPTDSASPADLVGAADRALYQAKREGRNCVRGLPAESRSDT